MPAISNTSPLILLAEIEHLHLLNDLYETIWVPDIVRAEVATGGSRPERVARTLETEWIEERQVDDATLQLLQPSSLHHFIGERQR